jgi:hypothetical protein
MIETRGIATVVIGLVRPHMEKTKPPRGLWVPFALGRPLGAAGDPSFQHRVLGMALGLLERRDGPVLLSDFPDDAPDSTDVPGWRPQIALPARGGTLPTHGQEWVNALGAEMAAVRPHWDAARQRFRKTMVGNSRLPAEAWANYAAGFLAGEVPASPVEGLSPAVLLRYVADDLKSFYGEAVQAADPAPSSQQVNRWFWGETVAGDFLRAIREAALQSPHNGFNTAGSRFVVPAPWVGKD